MKQSYIDVMEFFLWPFVFILLPLPYFVRHWMKPANNEQTTVINALRVPFFQQISAFALSTTQQYRPKAKIPLVLMWLFFICAAARPVWYGAVETFPQNARNIVLALDTSGSMQEQDFDVNNKPISRLSLVKTVADDFLAKRIGDRLSLVIFGSEAFTYTPLTLDTQTVRQLLKEVDIAIAGEMTAIGDALALSVANVAKLPAESRIVILLSDGYANAGVVSVPEALQLAKKLGIKIYTIGIGSEPKAIRDFFGFNQLINPAADLDEQTLSTIAEQTGGKYFRAKTTTELKEIYQTIDKLEPIEDKGQSFRPRKELFFIPLLGALVCLFWAIIKRRMS